MHHHSRRICIIHNGEIYNHVELRRELESKGHVFSSQTDTEVILAAWIEWGRECLQRFNGMWAFAIYDQVRKQFFCARDRFGVKPLYWVKTNERFGFASEIRQLLPLLPSVEADEDLVGDFLLTGLTDHTDRSFFQGVHSVPAGHWLSIDASTLEHDIGQYYKLAPADGADKLNEFEAAERLGELLQDSITLRLRSDVAVGTCLSGGLDSSSIATLAASRYNFAAGEKFRAITAVSSEPSTNEEHFAELVVRSADLQWTKTRPDYDEFCAALSDVVATQEEPFAGPSVFMQYFVMQAARANGVTVLLDGQGADEVLLGYERYYGAWLLDRYRVGGLREFAASFAAVSRVNANLPPLRLATYFLGSIFAPVRASAYRLRYPFLRKKSMAAPLVEFAHASRDAVQMQKLELSQTNLPMLLRYEDRNSMRHGVETRLPFLDYRLAEFAVGLPTSVKMHDGWTKWPLRKSMDSLMPAEIAWRKNKLGFEAPSGTWLGRHMPEIRQSVLGSAFLASHVDMKKLSRQFDGVDLRMIWRLYSSHLWSQQFHVR